MEAILVLLDHTELGCGEEGGKHVPFAVKLQGKGDLVALKLQGPSKHWLRGGYAISPARESSAGTELPRPQQAALASGSDWYSLKTCCLRTEIFRAAGQQGRLFPSKGLGRA